MFRIISDRVNALVAIRKGDTSLPVLDESRQRGKKVNRGAVDVLEDEPVAVKDGLGHHSRAPAELSGDV